MKSVLFTVVSLLTYIRSFAIDPLMVRSEQFVSQLGLSANETNLPPVHWTMPTNSFTYGELSGRFLKESDQNSFRLELTNSVGVSLAQIEFEEYSSNAEALVCIGFLAGGSGSAALEDLVDATTVQTNDVGVLGFVGTPSISTQGKVWKWCLYRNIGFECQVSTDIDGLNLASCILRAGGVDIPDEPEPQDPNLDPEL